MSPFSSSGMHGGFVGMDSMFGDMKQMMNSMEANFSSGMGNGSYSQQVYRSSEAKGPDGRPQK